MGDRVPHERIKSTVKTIIGVSRYFFIAHIAPLLLTGNVFSEYV